MKKHVIALWCIAFVLFLIAPHIVYPLVGHDDTEGTENRAMAELPAFSLETIETFPSDFEAYFNDTLPFRNEIIETNSYMNYALLKETSVSKVIIGQDNWLFYNPDGKDGDPVSDLNGENFLTEKELKKVLRRVVSADEKLAAQGIEFVLFVAPNKETVYGNAYLPAKYRGKKDYTTADQVVAYIREHSDVRVVYAKDAILKAKEKHPQWDLYFETDTHWNGLGGYIGTKALMEELGITLEEVSEENVEYTENAPGGDLAGMLNLSEYIQEGNSYAFKMNHDVQILQREQDFVKEFRYKTTSTNPQKLFMIRDSFCTFMADYIAPNYRESVMMHTGYYKPKMIEKEAPDVVVYEVVERYLRKLTKFTVSD